MQAKFIYEASNFERNQDPFKSMGVGQSSFLPKFKENIIKFWEKDIIEDYENDAFNFEIVLWLAEQEGYLLELYKKYKTKIKKCALLLEEKYEDFLNFPEIKDYPVYIIEKEDDQNDLETLEKIQKENILVSSWKEQIKYAKKDWISKAQLIYNIKSNQKENKKDQLFLSYYNGEIFPRRTGRIQIKGFEVDLDEDYIILFRDRGENIVTDNTLEGKKIILGAINYLLRNKKIKP